MSSRIRHWRGESARGRGTRRRRSKSPRRRRSQTTPAPPRRRSRGALPGSGAVAALLVALGDLEGLAQIDDDFAQGSVCLHVDGHRGAPREGAESAGKLVLDPSVQMHVHVHVPAPREAGGERAPEGEPRPPRVRAQLFDGGRRVGIDFDRQLDRRFSGQRLRAGKREAQARKFLRRACSPSPSSRCSCCRPRPHSRRTEGARLRPRTPA